MPNLMSDMPDFRKSTRSNASSSCVEVAKNLDGVVLVRDTKDRDGGILSFTPATWTTFTTDLHNGTFDRR